MPSTQDAPRKRGGLRPSLTATVRGALRSSGQDGETATFSRTKKRHEVGLLPDQARTTTFLPTPNSEEADLL